MFAHGRALMNGILRSSDPWSTAVIALTLALFLLALFLKGFTHDLLLEAAVFLVSVKLIMLGHKCSVATERADEHMRQVEMVLRTIQQRLHQPQDLIGNQSPGAASNLPPAVDERKRA